LKHQIVIMGVSGCGKTSVGEALANLLGCPFIDADDLHSAEAKAQMSSGIPLTDQDRWPWLARVGSSIETMRDSGVVMACSSLKRSYRNAIRDKAPDALFVHLTGTTELLLKRIGNRNGHFFPASMLESQLQILEPLDSDEDGFTLGIESGSTEIAKNIAGKLTA